MDFRAQIGRNYLDRPYFCSIENTIIFFQIYRCGKCYSSPSEAQKGLNKCGKCPGEPCCTSDELDDCGKCPKDGM